MIKEDSALNPARIFVNPTEERFSDKYRRWQGIPPIETSEKGRIFVNFYSGQEAEIGGNIMVLCTSDDKGKTFKPCTAVVEHPDPECRIYDPNLWLDPHNRLWMLVRTFDGIGESFSTDGGCSWTPGRKSHIDGPCSRFHIRRLKSGRLP